MISNHLPTNPTPQRDNLSTIPSPRAGFDRLLFSVPVVYAAPKLHLPESLGMFHRIKDHEVHSHPTYQRRAAYVAPHDTAFIDVLYQPRVTPRPLFQIQFRASIHHLLDLHVVDQTIKIIGRSIPILLDSDRAANAIVQYLLPFRLTLSEVELAIDFPAGPQVFQDLRRSLVTSWSRQHYAPYLDGSSRRRGSRAPGNAFSVYPKDEDGISVARVEWIIRRRQLRNLEVNTITDLRNLPWTNLALRRIRFVDFHPSRRNNDPLQYLHGDVAKVAGAAYVLRKHSPKDRPRLHRRFRPNEFHAKAEAALQEFEAELAGGLEGALRNNK